jgi:adenosylcobinamide-GDP ribazoletransferase
MLKPLALAVQSLTIIPLKIDTSRATQKDTLHSYLWYPVIGLLIGGILAGVHFLISPYVHPLITSLMLVVMLIKITGAKHYVGTAAITERCYGTQKEEGIGIAGAITACWLLVAKVLMLSTLAEPFLQGALLLMCATSRFSAVIGAYLLPINKKNSSPHSSQLQFRDMFFSVLIFAFVLLPVHLPKLVMIYSVTFAYTGLFILFLRKKKIPFNPHASGALIEATEFVTLLAVAVVTQLTY